MQDVKKWTHKDDFQGGKVSGVTLEKKVRSLLALLVQNYKHCPQFLSLLALLVQKYKY